MEPNDFNEKSIWPKYDPELYAILIKLLKDAYSTRAPYSTVFQVKIDYIDNMILNIIYIQYDGNNIFLFEQS